jgi:peptidoglycan/LPS O-acetylase OafA/YrhL
MQASTNKLISIQILRCLAALMIVGFHSNSPISHFSHAYWRWSDDLFMAAHYPSWANHLPAGVDIFFCISGFVMSMLADRARSTNARSFIVDRFARLLPPYWLFTMIPIAVYLVSPCFDFGSTGDCGHDAARIVKSFFSIPQNRTPILGVA